MTSNVKMGIHVPQNDYWIDTNYNKSTEQFSATRLNDVAQINHYFCKTKEEFLEKCERGRADSERKRTIEEFNGHTFVGGTALDRLQMLKSIREKKPMPPTNFNEIEDLAAINFMFGAQ